MTNQDKLLETCKRAIETRLGWGSTELWTNQDYEKLSLRILDETGVHLSAAMLKQIWGKIRYDSNPSITALDTLAKFAGYGGWRQFGLHVLGAQAVALETPVTEKPSDYRFFKKSFVIVVIVLIIVIAVLAFYGFMRTSTSSKRSVDDSKFTSVKWLGCNFASREQEVWITQAFQAERRCGFRRAILNAHSNDHWDF